jgi:hypothetical protein
MATIKRSKRKRQFHSSSPEEHNQRYLNDPDWERATELASQSRFEECNKVVNRVLRRYGKVYGR